MPFNFNYAPLNSSGLPFHSHLSVCLWHSQQMLWPISSAGGTNCSCTQSWTGCQQQVTTYFQLHKSDSRIICVACLSAPSHLSEIVNSACACSQTSSRSRFTDQCWSISFSVHLSAVLGVWHSDDPGWKTQEVSSLSRGVHLCCAQPLFGRRHPVPLLAAAHWPLPLTLKLHGRISP